MYDKTPVVQEQGAQTGKLFAAASSSRASVQATGHDVPVPGELVADAGINNHDAAMQIANAKDNRLEKCGIIRKNRSDE